MDELMQLRANGWIPNRLAHSLMATPLELITYPYMDESRQSVLIRTRVPGVTGDALDTWIVKGEKVRTTDHHTGLRDLRLMTAVCPRCQHEWSPKVSGENKDTHIQCPGCSRDYFATYMTGEFLGFQSGSDRLVLVPVPIVGMGLTWNVGSDRYAGTIVSVEDTKSNSFYFRDDEVVLLSGSEETCDAKYSYAPSKDGKTYRASWSKRYLRYKRSDSKGFLTLGVRNFHRDPSF